MEQKVFSLWQTNFICVRLAAMLAYLQILFLCGSEHAVNITHRILMSSRKVHVGGADSGMEARNETTEGAGEQLCTTVSVACKVGLHPTW
jgi:hypothetical protein